MNYLDNNNRNYDVNVIGSQLEKMRYHFRYTQVDVAKLLNITNQYWGRIEKGKVFLNIKKLVQVAKIFKIDINYFLLPDAEVNDYLFSTTDHQITMFTKKSEILQQPTQIEIFIETSVYKSILNYINNITGKITLLQTIPNNGTSTALKKISAGLKKKTIIIDNIQMIQKILAEIQNQHNKEVLPYTLVVIEDIENYPSNDIIGIIDYFQHSNANIIITSKLPGFFERYFPQFICTTNYLWALTNNDLKLFLKCFIPYLKIPAEKQHKLEMEINGNIKKILNTISLLQQQKHPLNKLVS